VLRLEFNLAVISPRGENWLAQTTCHKIHISRSVSILGRSGYFSGVAKPVFYIF
jgi:hypothetical protein